MKSANETNRERQYELASTRLAHYHRILKDASLSKPEEIEIQMNAMHQNYLGSRELVKGLRKLKKDYQGPQKMLDNINEMISSQSTKGREYKSKYDELVVEHRTAQRKVRSADVPSIEIILNSYIETPSEVGKYTDRVDIIMPIKEEDIVEGSLAEILETNIDNVAYGVAPNVSQVEKFHFNDARYVAYAIRGISKAKVLEALLNEVPDELGRSSRDARIHRKIAHEFSFKYNVSPTAQLDEPVPSGTRPVVSDPSGSVPVPLNGSVDPTKYELTREEAIVMLSNGYTSMQLSLAFPKTNEQKRLRIAGWASSYVKQMAKGFGSYHDVIREASRTGEEQEILDKLIPFIN